VKDLAEEAGVGKIHTHRLRHTALTVANDATGDLRAVSKFARHRRIETTMTYTRTTETALSKVMESLDYGAGDDPPEPDEESDNEDEATKTVPADREEHDEVTP
jgi:hypothetical protein